MPIATIELLAKHLPQLELINAYGATETTSPTTVMPKEWWRDHMDSVGQVIPYAVVKIVDDDPGTLAGELLDHRQVRRVGGGRGEQTDHGVG